jgi:FKBP-type peptidyl-prolyl cis-trans isomerase FkpA
VSAAETANRPANAGRGVKLWLGFLAVIAAALALAWCGAQSVRERTVQVRTVKAGSGPTVMPDDGVMIEYEGRLEDGKMFDSSEGKGPVPLLASQTIPGFAQALSKMQRGGRYHVHIPSRLAYGANPPPDGPIPANADLDSDGHVVQIVPNAAAMMQSGPPQQ